MAAFTPLVAYLPQRISEVGGVAILIGVLVSALPAIAFGRMSVKPTWSPRRVRVTALAAILLGCLFAILGFVTDAEPPGGLPGGPWGTHSDKVMLAVWVLFLGAIAAWNVAREVRFARRGPT